MDIDVVDLIVSDHREVERLFEILEKQPDQRGLTMPVLSALLIAHSRAEEAEVYPVARDQAGAGDKVAHSQEEHTQAEKLLEQLQAVDPAGSQFSTLLDELIRSVKHHVEEEESSVLPAIREQLDESRRRELAHAFVQSRAERLGERPGQASKEALYQQAENIDLPGRASMSKKELRDELQTRATDK